MSYDKDLLVEVKVNDWTIDQKMVVINYGGNKFLLNETSSLIWRLFDGFTSIGTVIDKIYRDYSEQNSREYIEQIVYTCIEQFENENLIILNEVDEFGGWFQYD